MGRDKGFEKKAALFTVKFFVVFAVLYALLLATDFVVLQEFLAELEAGLVGGESAGNIAVVNGEFFAVSQSCMGFFSGIVFLSIVFACRKPGPWKKIAVAVGGAVFLFLVNIARLYFVLLVAGAFGSAAAEWAHVGSWFAMTAVILLLWYYVTKKIVGKEFGELV